MTPSENIFLASNLIDSNYCCYLAIFFFWYSSYFRNHLKFWNSTLGIPYFSVNSFKNNSLFSLFSRANSSNNYLYFLSCSFKFMSLIITYYFYLLELIHPSWLPDNFPIFYLVFSSKSRIYYASEELLLLLLRLFSISASSESNLGWLFCIEFSLLHSVYLMGRRLCY